LADLGFAAEAGLAVDLHSAGAADRRPARAADRERAVLAVLRLQQPVEDRQRGIELDVEFLPVGGVAAFGLEPADLERVLGHLLDHRLFAHSALAGNQIWMLGSHALSTSSLRVPTE